MYVRNQSLAVCVYLGQPDDLGIAVQQRAGDIAARNYFNLSEILLPVEPEYAFDVPHDRWLLQWLATGAAIVLIAWLLAAAVRFSSFSSNLMPLLIAGLLGAVGTTVLGKICGEFIFTWPVCLYAAFEYVVAAGRPTTASEEPKPRFRFVRNRIPAFVFLGLSFAYFLLCRRLSLVFEWAFLMGFVGAVPILWFTYRRKTHPPGPILRAVVSVTGFACFFATAVLLLKMRY